jgi:hypothetical protein
VVLQTVDPPVEAEALAVDALGLFVAPPWPVDAIEVDASSAPRVELLFRPPAPP